MALEESHRLEWALLDLRWSNIINKDGKWYIIDCEFARPFGANLPNLKMADPESKVASAACDLYMVGQLLAARSAQLDDGGEKLCKLLLSRERHSMSASGVLKHPWLTRVHL